MSTGEDIVGERDATARWRPSTVPVSGGPRIPEMLADDKLMLAGRGVEDETVQVGGNGNGQESSGSGDEDDLTVGDTTPPAPPVAPPSENVQPVESVPALVNPLPVAVPHISVAHTPGVDVDKIFDQPRLPLPSVARTNRLSRRTKLSSPSYRGTSPVGPIHESPPCIASSSASRRRAHGPTPQPPALGLQLR